MTEAIPKWVLGYYALLWSKFKDKKFTHKEVENLIKIKNKSLVLSRLKRAGWLEMSLDPEDSRKSVYRLISPEKAVKGVVKQK